jgi:hypothetical protein
MSVALFICTVAKQQILPQAKKSGGESPPALLQTDKEQLKEALRLQQTLGDEIWPGFSHAAIPIILFNPLRGIPRTLVRGGIANSPLRGQALQRLQRVDPTDVSPWSFSEKWEYLLAAKTMSLPWLQISGDDFFGQPYLARPASDPEYFAVLVGDKWAGSCGTLSHMNSSSPLKLPPGFYVVALLHEMFHAFQANSWPERFRSAQEVYRLEKEYPYSDEVFMTAWNQEGAILDAALKATTEESAREQGKQFLSLLQKRRQAAKLAAGLIGFECELEWLEGLAKYAEIRFYELAAAAKGTTPNNPFHSWDRVRLKNSLGGQEGDMRFYLSGYAQARLLDRLTPIWKSNKKSLLRPLEEQLAAALGMEGH